MGELNNPFTTFYWFIFLLIYYLLKHQKMSKSKSSTSSELEPPTKARKLDNGEEMIARDIDKNTQEALEQIDSCQAEIDEINEKASTEILKVEQKFNGLRKPLFDRRAAIIQKIPNFWMTAMINHPQISILLEEPEEEALQNLKSLEVEECQDIKSGYRIHFHFDENQFFTNSILTKEFKLGMSGDPKSSSTTIEWKKGGKSNTLMNMLSPADSPSQPSSSSAIANGKSKRPRRKTFFGWFLDNSDPQCDETAEAIKDDLWPNPLHYYMTPDIEVDPDDDDDDEIDDEEDIDDEDLEEEGLEEEEEDLDREE